MNSFLKASRQKLRFNTSFGVLSTEALWGLEIEQLDTLAVSLEKQYKSSGGKSFVFKKSAKDKDIKLKFDIVISILTVKIEEQEVANKALIVKQHNAEIMEAYRDVSNKSLRKKSPEELLNMLK